jgi:hypothetical protein
MTALLWCGAGSNRRHKDFQSFALPTELPHHRIEDCKNRGITLISKRVVYLLFHNLSSIGFSFIGCNLDRIHTRG